MKGVKNVAASTVDYNFLENTYGLVQIVEIEILNLQQNRRHFVHPFAYKYNCDFLTYVT